MKLGECPEFRDLIETLGGKEMRKIDEIIVHCSDSNWGSALVIDSWHRQRGWKGCGYHFIIGNGETSPQASGYLTCMDGHIEAGRPISQPGAHCRGHNKRSIGICLIGKDSFTEAQFKSLIMLVSELRSEFGDIPVRPHSRYANKTCPSFNVADVLAWRF